MYNLFFQPIIDILKYIYLFIVKLTGNYGISLILLSLIVNIILRPISNWAAKIQDKERKIQEILAPQITEIKKNYHGAEQHAELSELYKRYGYNPLYAVRSGLDLFIQLPLLTAAYIMLSSLDVLNGQTFGIIKNLANPDNLFMGINILPVLMTFINFLATLTTKNFTKRERVQAFIIAILFLILLYDAPSALLIYWTTNNFIMLLKNFADIKIFKLSCVKIAGGGVHYKYTPSELWITVVNLLTFGVMLIAIFLYFYYMVLYGNRNLDEFVVFRYAYTCIALFSFIFAWTFFANALKREFYISEIIVKTTSFIVASLIIFLYLRYVAIGTGKAKDVVYAFSPSGKFFLALFIIYLAFALLLSVSSKKLSSLLYKITDNHENSIFFASIIAVIIFLCIFSPAVLYRSDPAFFTIPLSTLIYQLSYYGIEIFLIAAIIWLILPETPRRILAVIIAFSSFMFFINVFFLSGDLGQFDTVLKFSDIKIAIVKDIFSFLISALLFFIFVWRKKITRFAQFMALICLAFIGAGIFCYVSVGNYNYNKNKNSSEEFVFPEYHDKLWTFSRDNKNVLGIFVDMFTGDHIEKMIDEAPALAQKLDGFTFFPDMAAPGWATFYSATSIYGGALYRPDKANLLFPNATLREKFANAYVTLPNAFAEKNYDVIMAGCPDLEPDNQFFLKNIDKSATILYDRWGEDYIKYWEDWALKNNIKYSVSDDATSPYIFMLSLLRGIPSSLQDALSNNGKWFGSASEMGMQVYFKSRFLPSVFMQFMADFVKSDDHKPTFKMIYSMLPHVPWYLPADSLQPVDDPYPATPGQNVLVDGLLPEHYYTERHIIHFLCDFMDALKKNGVYDNTRIIIFSDHDCFDSWRLNAIFNGQYSVYPGRPGALLLFKDFNERGTLKTSDALMACEDVPALLLSGIASADGVPSMEELKKISGANRVRTHLITPHWDQPLNTYLFNPGVTYEITGSMFKKDNWKRIQNNFDERLVYELKKIGAGM